MAGRGTVERWLSVLLQLGCPAGQPTWRLGRVANQLARAAPTTTSRDRQDSGGQSPLTIDAHLSNSQLFEQDLTCRPLLPLLCPLSHRGSHAVSARGHLTRLLFRGVGHCPLFFFLLSPRERRERPPSILQAAIRRPQPAKPQSANVATRQNKQILSILPCRHFDTPLLSPGLGR